jgi:hypothetical protein
VDEVAAAVVEPVRRDILVIHRSTLTCAIRQ